MPKRKTKAEFITEAQKVHGNKYDYSEVNYVNNSEKVTIICPEHGPFEKSPGHHLRGQGCRICKGYVELTQKSFLERAKKVHRDRYDYSKSIVKSKKDKVEIVCREHGSFYQTPGNHIKGQGCPVCGQISRTMSQRDTLEEFVSKARSTHGSKYDYSKVEYVNSQTKVEIICSTHGSFKMKANSHLNGQGCPKCGHESTKEKITLDYSEFLERAEKTHGNQYEYVEETYKNYTTKMKMFCAEHGFFWQKPHSHISMKTGCPECGKIKAGRSNTLKWEVVLDMFRTAHGDRYTYDEDSYKSATRKMRINCDKHGWFEQRPYGHYAGYGCNECAVEEVHERQRIGFKDFVKRAKDKHGNRYNYPRGEWEDIFTPIHINCEKHGEFLQVPRDHYRGSGCPKCISSRGENEIRLVLEKLNIQFKEQKKFKGLKYRTSLKCDFYLPKLNTVIEYNGLQHYEPIEVFGGVKGLQETQKRDLIKYEYLEEKNIRLVIIRYDVEDIENYLRKRLLNV